MSILNRVSFRCLPTGVLLAVSTVLASGLASPAIAQLAPPAPVRQSIDTNGVDLFFGTINVDAPIISMGSSEPQGIAYYQINRGSGWGDNTIATINASGSTYTVTFGGRSDGFNQSGSAYTSTESNGSTLTLSGSIFTYTSSDGTVAHFDQSMADVSPYYASAGRVVDIARPSGQKINFTYHGHQYCSGARLGQCIYSSAYRIDSVFNNYGYSLKFQYQLNDSDINWNSIVPGPLRAQWGTVIGATLINKANASAASVSESFATVTSGSNIYFQVTDPLSRTTKYRMNGSQVVGITKPSSSSEDVSVGYASGRVISVTTPVGTTAYSSSDNATANERTIVVTDPGSNVSTYVFNLTSKRLKSFTDANGNLTAYTYDASGRITRETKPEGNYSAITYDGRGNRTELRSVAKAGSGLSDIVTSANYPTSCSNPATCNQPTYTVDARGSQTDYAYDSTTGLVTSVTAPASTVGAIRPQTRYVYTSYQAYYDPAGGSSYTASGSPVTLLTGVSQCQTGASCAGTSDEVMTTVSYGPQTSGVGNNLLPVAVSKGAGDGSLTGSTAIAYDSVGNVIGVDGPLSGTADTTTYRYDANRERVGVIAADPDGAGALKRRAIRTTYNAHGIAVETELGTVNGTSDSDWSAFTSLQQVTTTLDAADRKAVDTVTAGGTTYSVTQYGYDTASRPDCVATRMNSATWTSLSSSACTMATTGSFGPDRISKTTYDAADRVVKVQTAFGTVDQADEATAAYNNNGTLATLTDAVGNKTTYEYDGVDRLVKTRYPAITAGSGTSSTTDYEQLVYDPGSNVTSRRLRGYASDSTQRIDYSYDALNRLVQKDLSGSELDVTFGYDLLSRPISAATSAQALLFSYDALGRNITQSGPLGTTTSDYDLAGRRTMLAWPDSFYVTYDYLVTGEMTAIRENGSASGVGVLATFGYDDLGQRTSLTRGNGAVTSYTPDAVSRLETLTHDLAGTSADLTLGFNYNPAGQIASTTRSNDGYAWTAGTNRDDASSANGLNQILTVGAGNLGYDARGNLTSTGTNSYNYSSENLLTGTNLGVSLAYDPLNRLSRYTTPSSVVDMLYDGSAAIADVSNTGSVSFRYIWGPQPDELLVTYLGANTATRRFWSADERGSIIAASNASGAVTDVFAYDEYGVPGGANTPRFGYTGQRWLAELGLSYYKARMYSTRLGRFLQTDPIGYADGMNWYNYVGGDPVNFTDPSGLDRFCGAGRHAVDQTYSEGNTTFVRSVCVDDGGGGGGSLRFSSGDGPRFGGGGGGGSGPQNDDTGEDIVVTAAKKIGQCAADQFGLGELAAAAAVAAGQPIPGTKRFVTPGSSRGTSVAGMAADKVFGRARSPVRLPGIVGGPGTGRALAIVGTKSVARFAGRAVPIVGWALLAYDAASIAVCAASDD